MNTVAAPPTCILDDLPFLPLAARILRSMAANPPPPPAAKRSCFATLVSWMFAGAVIAFCIALMWVTLVHWHRDGQFSFRLFDPAWWRPGVDSAQQHADDAGQALWAPGGLIPKAEAWWDARSATTANPSAGSATTPAIANSTATGATVATVAASGPVDDAPRRRLEAQISGAETDFQLGLDEYRAANPANGTSTLPQRDHLRQAKAHFLLAKDALDHAIPAYADAIGHDPDRLADATALRDYNRNAKAHQ
jgi:hypothetical protein